MPLRSLTTTESYQMGFFLASDFSPVGISHRFARQGSFKTFFNKTFLELLDFFGGDFIGCSNVRIGPTTSSIGFEQNIGINDRAALSLVLGDDLSYCSTFGVCQVHGISYGHYIALTLRWKWPHFNRVFQHDKALGIGHSKPEKPPYARQTA